MRYDASFNASLSELFDRRIDAATFWRRHEDRFRARARYFLARYIYTGLTEDDLVQVGFAEVLERVGHASPKPGATGKVKTWDPTREKTSTLPRYVEWGIGNSMKSRLNLALGRPDAKRGRPPVRYVPSAAMTLGPDARTRVRGEPVPDVEEAVAGWSQPSWEMLEDAEACVARTARDDFERRALVLTFAAVHRGFTIEQVSAAVQADPVGYGGMTQMQYRALLYRAGAGRIPVGPREEHMNENEYTDGVEVVAVEVAPIEDTDGIDAVTEKVSRAWGVYVKENFRLAALLHQVSKFRVWEREGRYTSFHDFLKNGVKLGDGASKTTCYALVKAYEECLTLADELDQPAVEIWNQWGYSKLSLLPGAPGDVRKALVDAGMAGASRPEMERMIEEAKQRPRAEVEEVPEREERGPREESPDRDTDETLTVYKKVTRGKDYEVDVRDIATEEVTRIPVERAGDTYFVYYLDKTRVLMGRLVVERGMISKVVLRWDEAGGDEV